MMGRKCVLAQIAVGGHRKGWGGGLAGGGGGGGGE